MVGLGLVIRELVVIEHPTISQGLVPDVAEVKESGEHSPEHLRLLLCQIFQATFQGADVSAFAPYLFPPFGHPHTATMASLWTE